MSTNTTGLVVELREVVNPARAAVESFGPESGCLPDGCKGINTRVSGSKKCAICFLK